MDAVIHAVAARMRAVLNALRERRAIRAWVRDYDRGAKKYDARIRKSTRPQ